MLSSRNATLLFLLLVAIGLSGSVPKASGQNLFVTNAYTGAVDEYTTKGTLVAHLITGLYGVYDIVFTPSNTLITEGGEYDATTGALMRSLDWPDGSVVTDGAAVLDSAGNYWSSTWPDSIVQIDIVTGMWIQSWQEPISQPTLPVVMPNGDLLVANSYGDYGGTLTEINPSTMAASTFATGLGEAWNLRLGPDGRYYVADGAYDLAGNDVRVVSADGQTVSRFSDPSVSMNGPNDLVFDGRNLFVVSFYDGYVYEFNGTTGTYINKFFVGEGAGGLAVRSAVSPTKLSLLSISPSSVVGGNSTTGKVTLNGVAPVYGFTVTLTSNLPSDALVPMSVTVPPGATSATFSIETTAVSAKTTVTLSAAHSKQVSAKLTLLPAALASLTLSSNTIQGGTPVTGTVTLNGPAATNIVVNLTNTNRAARLPDGGNSDTVTIPTGASSISFTITTVSPGKHSAKGTIKAAYNGVTKSANLTVTP